MHDDSEFYAAMGLAFTAALILATLIIAFAITYQGVRP